MSDKLSYTVLIPMNLNVNWMDMAWNHLTFWVRNVPF